MSGVESHSGSEPARQACGSCCSGAPKQAAISPVRMCVGPVLPGSTPLQRHQRHPHNICCTEHPDRSTFETRHYICSAKLDIERLARGARGHWGVESMHWLLDVQFKDDLCRYRTGHGAKNMAVVRRFSLNLVRINPQKGSVKTKRKSAGWNPSFMRESSASNDRQPGFRAVRVRLEAALILLRRSNTNRGCRHESLLGRRALNSVLADPVRGAWLPP